MPTYCTTEFDEIVNQLLENGWEITKREYKHTQGLPDEAFNIPVVAILYAELERRC